MGMGSYSHFLNYKQPIQTPRVNDILPQNVIVSVFFFFFMVYTEYVFITEFHNFSQGIHSTQRMTSAQAFWRSLWQTSKKVNDALYLFQKEIVSLLI